MYHCEASIRHLIFCWCFCLCSIRQESNLRTKPNKGDMVSLCWACAIGPPFLLIRPIAVFHPSSALPSPLSITRFYVLFEQTINIIKSFAFSPGKIYILHFSAPAHSVRFLSLRTCFIWAMIYHTYLAIPLPSTYIIIHLLMENRYV